MFYCESLKATEHLPACVKMRSAKHDERIVSDQKIKWNGQIWIFKVFHLENLKVIEHIPVCVKMWSSIHDERIVSDQKIL